MTSTSITIGNAWATSTSATWTRRQVVYVDATLSRIEEERQLNRRIGWGRFARIMEEVWRCLLQEERKERLVTRYQAAQRFDSLGLVWDWTLPTVVRDLKREASAEWSRRVREGVKRLPPVGPAVYCQGEEDEP